MEFTRRTFIFGAIATPALGFASPYFLADNAAIRGYDPVAYFTQGEPVLGSAEFSADFGGATWHFATKEHREMFVETPDKYAPQYGGYCAFAVSRGYTAETDPEAWTVHNDKLYLNYSKSVRTRWLRNIDENISLGDANWPSILADL